MPAPHDPQVAGLGLSSRRSFMAGTTVAAAAAALTACTAQGGGPRRGDTTPKPGVLVGSVDHVPVGGGKVFPNASVVVTQPTAGTYVGLSAICSHQQCTLREVSVGKIFCGCHGSEFDLQGKVLKGPAQSDLAPRAITVDGTEIRTA